MSDDARLGLLGAPLCQESGSSSRTTKPTNTNSTSSSSNSTTRSTNTSSSSSSSSSPHSSARPTPCWEAYLALNVAPLRRVLHGEPAPLLQRWVARVASTQGILQHV